MKKTIAHIACFPIYLYRFTIKPMKGSSTCAFTPTCSEYGLIAIKRHGVIVGWWMATGRILRCNPFSRKKNKGYDPVPYKMKGGAKWVI